MTIEELAHTITRLSVPERLTLIELISRSVRETVAASGETGIGRFEAAPVLEAIEKQINGSVGENSALHQLLGIAALAAEAPSDEQVRNWLADELTERHR